MVAGKTSVGVSIIVPTWNERNNIVPLLQAIHEVLAFQEYEVVVVDDTGYDGTAQVVERHMRVTPAQKGVLLLRPYKAGLAGAVIEGATVAQGEYLVMMDGDLSHHPSDIPPMLQKLKLGYHLVVGSRYMDAVSALKGWPLWRRLASRLAIVLARLLLRLEVRDLTSGFVAFRRMYLTNMRTRFSVSGFKLLLEMLVVWPGLLVAEHPIVFTDRRRGTSKFGVLEVLEFGRLCIRLCWYRLWHRQ